ncbi:ADP-ribosylhydrolase ARH3-like isoform X2 [Toxorhynchites rutilus septentrionalis]|uniref:ADP-ribosylhydrolase ARH3-like isoform X2 n=1 Tax=Toxorhynchites rutilus septentrionalis TaxID=329112 RepID=UPI0024797CFF|nr:ADP-ribosylhydrolase ARH3-like isoform X2 [Toxorhynchites rutilus septentrionalis]
MIDKILMRSKFRGTLLGALIGDCCGAPFEGQIMDSGTKLVLKNNLDRLEGPFFKAPYKKYTDDTAMTKCVANTILDSKGFSQTLLAKNFVVEYFKDPRRGYGAAVVDVFAKLRNTKIADPTGPAAAQFGGTGSYGNGAAMRISPVALFCANRNKQELVQLVRDSSLVTHSNVLGVNGAILQALAIHQCLQLNPKDMFDRKQYISQLKADIAALESANDPDLDANSNAYMNQLHAMEQLLEDKVESNDENVLNTLGHSVEALYSVPTAIFCFLKCLSGTINDNLLTIID